MMYIITVAYNKFCLKEGVLQVDKLFDVGTKSDNPLIIGMNNRKLIAFCRDNLLFFLDHFGNINYTPEVKLSDIPLQIGFVLLFIEIKLFYVI